MKHDEIETYIDSSTTPRLAREIMLICDRESTLDTLRSLIFVLTKLSVEYLEDGVSIDRMKKSLIKIISKSIDAYYKVKKNKDDQSNEK